MGRKESNQMNIVANLMSQLIFEKRKSKVLEILEHLS